MPSRSAPRPVDPLTADDDQPDAAATIPWSILCDAIAPFDGHNAALTDDWLDSVSAIFAPYPALAPFRVAAARKRLTGLASAVMASYLGCDWQEFATRLRRRFQPEAAKAEIQRQLRDGRRYRSIAFSAALDLAVTDYEVLGSGLSYVILDSLAARVPSTVLDSVKFSPGDDFYETIEALRLVHSKGQTRSDKHSDWATSETVRQYAVVTEPTAEDNRHTVSSRRQQGRRGPANRDSQRRRPNRDSDRIAKLEQQLRALTTELRKDDNAGPQSPDFQ